MSFHKVPGFNVLIENRRNNGTEPPNFSPEIRTESNQLYNFGSGESQPPLLPDATRPIWATHISHNNTSYILSLAPGPGDTSIGPIEGNGTPVAFKNGDKIDITKWTIQANPKF